MKVGKGVGLLNKIETKFYENILQGDLRKTEELTNTAFMKHQNAILYLDKSSSALLL